jgi:hypothetical protein
MRRLRRLSYILDRAIPIPGTPYRFGLDSILGLLPGGGDFIGMVISAYIVFEAARFGLPRETLLQMVTNIIVDAVIGSIPVLGDLGDVVWKANAKNVALLEEYLDIPQPERRRVDWLFLALLFGVLFLIVIGIGIVSVLLLRWLLGAVFN